MPEIDLKRLRNLRHRAEVLLTTLGPDLEPFRHADALSGFRRKPDSDSLKDDVNITTTCSCLMGLALSGRVVKFYEPDGKEAISKTFQKLFDAPWMSSGLGENNAFTTTLVIRLFGFLVESNVVTADDPVGHALKLWESRVVFSKFELVAKTLVAQEHPLAKFLFELFTPTLQKALELFEDKGSDPKKTESQVATELERLIRTTHFFQAAGMSDLQWGSDVADMVAKGVNGYNIPKLNRLLLHELFADNIEPLKELSLSGIAAEMSLPTPSTSTSAQFNLTLDRFGINDYPPAAAVMYWFVDGVARAEITLPSDNWTALCKSASDQFGRQRSISVAKQAATMDPVAMAMAACLCARLRTISEGLLFGANNSHHAMLPSIVELESAIVDLFGEQTSSGIWPKYFPLFHYQDAGSNFCFTFELLEAVLYEFGAEHNRLVREEAVVLGLERAVSWCETNRLQSSESKSGKAIIYNGWNSGGNLDTLRRGQPESWATAVVHMFLWELVEVLSRHVQQRLLEKYNSITPSKDWRTIDGLLDIELLLNRKPASLKDILRSTIIKTFSAFPGKFAERLRKEPSKKGRLSALLFGPPGTSKTEVAKAIAAELKWPLVEIDPSHFLQDSFQNIYVQAEKIFEDVMDMCGVVVLFDEMDALVQKRDDEHGLDTESKFLTTYMLPKLAKLHDRRQIVFLMATNFQASFDDAIKRAGRFDLLLCMGPPILKDKCNSVHKFLGCKQSAPIKQAGKIIADFASSDPWIEDQLTLYTFGEFKSFIESILTVERVDKKEKITKSLNKLKALTLEEFRKLVKDDSRTVGLKFDALDALGKALNVEDHFRLKDLDAANYAGFNPRSIDIKIPVVKYMLDRQQSKEQ